MRRPDIVVPLWQRLESGLLVPSSVFDPREFAAGPLAALPPELDPPVGPVAVLRQFPSSADDVAGGVNEEQLDVPRSTLSELRRLAAGIPFEPGFLVASRLAADVWFHARDLTAQLNTIRRFEMPELLAALERATAPGGSGGPRFVFAEQYITALQRILIEEAFPRTLEEGASDDALRAVVRAYFAAASVSADADGHLMADRVDQDTWLVYLFRNGVYNARSPQHLHAFVRALRRAATPIRWASPGGPNRRVDGARLRPEQPGATRGRVLSIWAAGGFDRDRPVQDRTVVVPPFAQSPLADRAARIEETLTASREWYAAEFANLAGQVGDEQQSVAWERWPFLQRPFLRLANGAWRMISPRAIDSWLGDGFFYRALDAAHERRASLRFMRFFGLLLERYCLELAESVYPVANRPVEAGRAYGDQPYGKGGKRTFDIALACGTDLIAVEVVSARLDAEMQVGGDTTALAKNLERMLFKKMRQLATTVQDVLSGAATIPDVELETLLRIWPIVVTAGKIMQNELLWNRIDAELPAGLRDRRIGALIVLDIDEYEYLLGLGAAGEHLPTLLRRFTTGFYRDLSFIRFGLQDLGAPSTTRPPIIDERWDRLGQRTREVLFPQQMSPR